jgi:transcriptional regulator with XRE-family HTH domain
MRPNKKIAKTLCDRTYTDIAAAIGISVGQVSYIFRGMRSPSLGVARRLARTLGCSIDDLERYLAKCKAKQACAA